MPTLTTANRNFQNAMKSAETARAAVNAYCRALKVSQMNDAQYAQYQRYAAEVDKCNAAYLAAERELRDAERMDAIQHGGQAGGDNA